MLIPFYYFPILTNTSLIIGLVIGALLLLSTISHFKEAKIYLLPIICGGLLWGTTALFTLFIIEANEHIDFSFGYFFSRLTIVGSMSFILGCLIGALLYFGSELWASKRKLLSALIVLLSFLLSVASIPAIFFMLVLAQG